jgi:hypothetical protein
MSFIRIRIELSKSPGSNALTPICSLEISQSQSNVFRLVRRNCNAVAGELKVKFTWASQHDRSAANVLYVRDAEALVRTTCAIHCDYRSTR